LSPIKVNLTGISRISSGQCVSLNVTTRLQVAAIKP